MLDDFMVRAFLAGLGLASSRRDVGGCLVTSN